MSNLGLSPRVRGNPFRLINRVAPHGSIPACTGEPDHARHYKYHVKVYPRVYGGTASARTPQVTRPGSIPACTGEPAGRAPREAPNWVYPRVYGGTRKADNPLFPVRGLSPRVRGNQPESMTQEWSRRSIPACTGEPTGIAASTMPDRVYPRVYGGTNPYIRDILFRSGLSPRVRGNP